MENPFQFPVQLENQIDLSDDSFGGGSHQEMRPVYPVKENVPQIPLHYFLQLAVGKRILSSSQL